MDGRKHRAVTAALLTALAVGSVPAYATAAQDAPSAKHQEHQQGTSSQASGQEDAQANGQEPSQSSLPKSLAAALKDGSLGTQAASGSLVSDGAAKTYAPDDVVTLIVQLKGDARDSRGGTGFFSADNTRESVKSQISGIVSNGTSFFGLGAPALDVTHDYYTVMQGFAVRVPYKYVDQIRALDGVKNAFPEHAYAVPTDQGGEGSGDASAIASTGNNDQYMNGNSLNMVGAGASGLTGKHTVTAIIDSGLDVNHEAFSGKLDAADLDLTADEVEAAKDELTGAAGAHVSDKIPFAYDYADSDDDVVPHADGLEHGTHVAGIIGANGGEKIRGVSPDTQLVAMKVASDATGALYDSAIIAALDDATKLDVDAINMSLGTDAGFPDDQEDTYNDIYNAVRDHGIQLNVAAGNSTNAAQGNKSGQNKPYATDPDYSIVSSPATYDASLAVASVDALDRGMYLKTADGKEFPYKASSANSATLESLNGTYKVVDAGYGHTDEIPDAVAGNVALIQRGSADASEQFSFADKVKNAADKGAVAVIVYNNVDEDALQAMSVDDARVPSVFVTKAAGEAIKAAGSITVSPDFSRPATQMTMSDFSSWGVSPNLELKPEITAPGGQIYSSVLNDSYEYMSGTSMATPQVSGLAASMYQYLEQAYPKKSKTEVYDLSEALLMSTAEPIAQGEGSYVSPRKQGAGEASLARAATSPAYLTVKGADANKPKADLGDSADGSYSFTLTVHNLSDKQLSYTLDAAALGENIADGFFQGTSTNFAGAGVDVAYSTGSSVTVPANGTADVTVTIKAGEAFKSYAQAAPNGTFLDGFVFLRAPEGGVDLSVPYLGFYGDWEKVPFFDAAAGTDEQPHMFQTIVGSPDSSAMLGANVLNADSDVSKVNNPARFALSPNSLGDYFKRFTTNTGLLRNAGRLTYAVTPKDDPSKVLREYRYDDIAKSYYVASADAVSYAEAFLGSDKPIVDTKDDQGKQLADGWYTFTESAYAMDADDPDYQTVDDTYSFDFYVDSKAPEIRGVKIEGEGADKKIKVTVADAHYVSAVELTSYDGQSSLGKLFEGGEATQTTDADGNHVYEFDFSYDEVKAKADEAGMPMSTISVAAYDYALNSASEQKVLEKVYPTSISIDQATSGDADYDGVYDQTLTVGQDLDLTVTFDPDYATERDITWTTDDDAKVKVSKDGVVTATGASGEDATYVYAMPEYDENDESVVPDELKVSLGFNVEAIPEETGIVVNRDALDLDEGAEATLRATTTDALKDQKVTWKSSNEDVAAVKRKDDGTVTVTAKASGAAEITASVTSGGKTYTATAKVTVSNANDKLYDMDEDGVITGYHGSSADLVLPTNATGIADYAFAGLQVKSVTLNAGLKTIGAAAFQGDEQLTTLTIPAGSQLESIGDSAFEGATVLTGDLVLPASFKSLGTAAFKDTIITGVDLSQTAVTEIPDDAFNGASSLASVKLPQGGSLKAIGASSFATTLSLTKIDLPEGLESIGDEAFNGGALISFKAPSSLKSIGVTAFGGLPLGKVELNDGLESIGDTAFSGVGATELSIPSSVTSIGRNAFEGMASLRKISFGGKNPVPASPFVEDYALRTIEVREGAENLKSGGEGELLSADGATLAAYPLGALEQGDSYTVPAGVKVIAPWSFYGATRLSGLDLGAEVEEVGDHAFMTSAVKEVVVPAGAKLESIGDNAFYLDTKLEKVDLGDSVKSVGSYAFSESPVLTSVDLGSVESIGDYAFAKSTALESFSFPDSVTAVGTAVLQNSPKIKKVHVGKNVPALDSDTFVGLSALEGIDVAEGNAAMKSVDGVLYAKGDAGALTLTRYPSGKADEAFEAPEGVVALADYSLSDNPYLKRASFKEGLASVGTSAFNGDSALEQLSLPDSVAQVGSVAFSGTALETVELGPNVAGFDGVLGPFSLTANLKHIVITGGKDLAIPSNMGMEALESVYLGPGVTSLDGSAFPEAEAPKLKTVVVDADLTAAPAGALPAGATVYVTAGHDATAALLAGQGYKVQRIAGLSATVTAAPATAKPGEKVTLTAQAAGGAGAKEYRFVEVAADGSEKELRAWGASAELKDYAVPQNGVGHVRAYARDASRFAVAADITVGAELGEGTYAVAGALLTADGTATSPVDALFARTDGKTAFAHVKVAKDGSADVTVGFAAGQVTGIKRADGKAARAAAPADAYTIHVDKLEDRVPVAVSTAYADEPVTALLTLDLGTAVSSANVADLASLLDQATALNPTRYTEESWKALVTARDAASAVYDQVGAKQDAVNAAADKLRAAIAGLKGSTSVQWPADGTYDVALSGKNMLLGNGKDLFGDKAQIVKDQTGTYLLLTLRPAAVTNTDGSGGTADATMVKQFQYYLGDDASTPYDAGDPVSKSADGKTATWKLKVSDVKQTVTPKVWWKNGLDVYQPADPILTLGTITPATAEDAAPEAQAKLAAAYNRYAALDLSAYEDGDAKSAFSAALDAARKLLADPESSADTLAAAAKALDSAASKLSPRIDAVQAADAVKRYEELKEGDYTKASWAPFKAALDELKSLAGQRAATSDLSAAYAKVVRASLKLVRAANTSALSGAISAAADVEAKLGNYQDGAEKNEFTASLGAARELAGLDLAQTDQAKVNAAASRLVKATAALRAKPKAADKGALVAAVEKADAIDLAHYDDGKEKDAFEAALKAARDVAADDKLTVSDQTSVDDATKRLEDAMKALAGHEKAADKAKLEEQVAAARTVSGKLGDYEDGAAKDAFEKALKTAEALLSDGKLTYADQDRVDAATAALEAARSGLRLKAADLSALKDAVRAAEKLDLGDYEDGAAKDAFGAALKDAEAILDGAAPSVRDQAKVDAAAKALTEAQKALKKKETTPGSENPGTEKPDTKPDAEDPNTKPDTEDPNAKQDDGGEDTTSDTGKDDASPSDDDSASGKKPAGKKANAGDKPGSSLPQTGDFAMAATGGLGLLGAALAYIGSKLRRK